MESFGVTLLDHTQHNYTKNSDIKHYGVRTYFTVVRKDLLYRIKRIYNWRFSVQRLKQ